MSNVASLPGNCPSVRSPETGTIWAVPELDDQRLAEDTEGGIVLHGYQGFRAHVTALKVSTVRLYQAGAQCQGS